MSACPTRSSTSLASPRSSSPTLESVSTLRLWERREIEASLVQAGFALVEIRDAPDPAGARAGLRQPPDLIDAAWRERPLAARA